MPLNNRESKQIPKEVDNKYLNGAERPGFFQSASKRMTNILKYGSAGLGVADALYNAGQYLSRGVDKAPSLGSLLKELGNADTPSNLLRIFSSILGTLPTEYVTTVNNLVFEIFSHMVGPDKANHILNKFVNTASSAVTAIGFLSLAAILYGVKKSNADKQKAKS